ncbi:MAG: hypothetical protein GX817_07105, partial [Elusimicrobia bacterium]|nr:hypothetical protein [Elusimicrobiota bacterium]
TMSVDREIPTPHLHTLVVEDVGVQSLDEMSSFEYPVNKISFILESDYISIDTHTTSVTVTTPDSTYIEDGYLGVLTSTGPEKRTAFVFEFDSPLVEEGIYYVEITGYDIWGNFAKYNFSFSILPFPYLDTNLKLTVTWEMGDDIDTGGNILTWLAPQDLIGNLTYTIMRLTGYEVPGRTVEADGILLETFENADILEYHDMPLPPGSYTYLVRVEDRHGGLVEGKAVSRFFKSSDFSYTDEEKLTSGYNLLWNINYSIPYNAHVTATIFSSTTLMGDFSYDANGFLQLDPAGNAAEVKKLIDNELTTASRNEAEGHNTIRWDWDDESGRLVPPGEEYKIFFEIVHNGQLVDTYLANLPVYNLFIENLDAVDISPEELTSSIQFDLSGDAEILFLITKPDTLFINATSSGTLNYLNNYYYDYEVGQPIPVNPTDMTVAADRIVRVKKLSRAYGKAQMEWSGLDQAAKPVPNGNYKAALLVYNAYGYAAKREIITISVYRGITTPPENVPPMLYDLSPSSASKVAPRLHNISFKLTDESGIDHSQTSIVIEGPRNAPIVYTHDDGATLMYYNQTSTAAKYALIFDTHTRLETQGYYDTTINTADVWGNTITFSSSFLISTTTPRLVSIVPEDELRMIRGIKEIKFTLEDFEGGWIDIDKTVVTLRRGNEAQTFTVDDREHLFYNIQKNQVDFVLTFETELKPGNYIVEIHATDKWGYTNILQSGFVIEIEDLSLPQLTSIYPEDQEIIKKPLKTIEFTLSHKDGINASETSITVVSPIGEIFAPGLYANISSISRTPMERTFTLSLNESLEENGEYQVIIYAVTGSDEVVENEDGEEGEESRPVADSVTREFSTTFTLELPQSSAQFAKTVVAYPQPLTEGAATITYKIDEPSELRIEVYNLMQEKVFGQEFGLAVGEGTVQWNATDNKGKRVAPGIYFFRLIAENDENKMRAMKKIVIVR